MKKVLLIVLTVTLLLAACSPQAQATELPPAVEGQPTHINVDITPAQRAAISSLAKNLGLTPDRIKIVSTEAVEWPDSCLGVSVEGVMCSQVVTPGFRIVLEANGKQVEYHTNQDGSVVVPATVALTWSRNGGIAGFCDNLTIYLSGEVQGTNCKSGDMVEKSISGLLSPAEIATMNEWISKYGEITIDASDPKGAADAMSVKLTMYGTGTQQSLDKASQQVLLTFIQNLNQKLMSK
ncbi:MAG: hypothetical protein ACM3XO_23435 [Bacteroidota bacterium]